MKTTARVYVITVHPSSRTLLRLWTGKSLHALRRCNSGQMAQTLAEMQHSLDELHQGGRARSSEHSYSINRSR